MCVRCTALYTCVGAQKGDFFPFMSEKCITFSFTHSLSSAHSFIRESCREFKMKMKSILQYITRFLSVSASLRCLPFNCFWLQPHYIFISFNPFVWLADVWMGVCVCVSTQYFFSMMFKFFACDTPTLKFLVCSWTHLICKCSDLLKCMIHGRKFNSTSTTTTYM